MIEDLLKKSKGNYTIKKLIQKVKRHINNDKLARILGYLEYSGKIIIKERKSISWNRNPDGTQRSNAHKMTIE